MAGPLLTYANNLVTAANVAKSAADAAVAANSNAFKTAQTVLGQKAQELAAANKAIADIKAQLALIPTSDDGSALLTQLSAAIIGARHKQADALTAEDDAASAAGKSAKASIAMGNAAARLAEAKTFLAAATDADTARQALRAAAATPPLSSLKAAATSGLTAAAMTAADTRLTTDLTAKLRGRADADGDRETNRVVQRKRVDIAAQAAIGSKLSATDNAQRVLGLAQAALSDYVLNAQQRFDQANASLAKIADPAQSSLTPEEALSIQSKDANGAVNSALKTAREGAADAAKELDDAQKAVDTDNASIETAIITALAANVDADPETNAAVTTARGTLATDTTALAGKQGAFTPAKVLELSKWEAAVPDATFQLLVDFRSARQTLTDLSAQDPAILVGAMDTAETDLVTALNAADKLARTLNTLRETAAEDTSLAQAAISAGPRRAFSAVRGDFD